MAVILITDLNNVAVDGVSFGSFVDLIRNKPAGVTFNEIKASVIAWNTAKVDEAKAAKDAIIAARNETITAKEATIADRNTTIANNKIEADAKFDAKVLEMTTARQTAIDEQRTQLNAACAAEKKTLRDELTADKVAKLDELRTLKDAIITEREANIAEKVATINLKNVRIDELQATVAEKDARITTLQAKIDEITVAVGGTEYARQLLRAERRRQAEATIAASEAAKAAAEAALVQIDEEETQPPEE